MESIFNGSYWWAGIRDPKAGVRTAIPPASRRDVNAAGITRSAMGFYGEQTTVRRQVIGNSKSYLREK
jgi:hypothetical protein